MNATVPFLDLRAAYCELREEIDAAIARVLDSGWYILGEEVEAFERAFAAFTESAHCIGVGNGLDALRLALEACGVGSGDEVLVPSNTFIATWLAVQQLGAIPVPVEPEPGSHNLDPERLQAALTSRTRAVLPVHLYGQPADLDPILAFARSHGLRVIEDAAQAHGARYRGRRIGGHADAITWSFYPGKNLGAFGDGGAITTDDPAIADRLHLLRNYGSRVRYVHEVAGGNSRLDPIQAAALRVKLQHLDDWNDRRRVIATRYAESLSDCGLTLPVSAVGTEPVWHLYVVRTPHRDALQAALAARGVQTLIHYPTPPHRQGAFAEGAGHTPQPIAEQLSGEVLSLPIGPHLTQEDCERVIAEVRSAAAALAAG